MINTEEPINKQENVISFEYIKRQLNTPRQKKDTTPLFQLNSNISGIGQGSRSNSRKRIHSQE